ncbi:hypothetical protein KMP13_15580 [Epibacterium ulvae]|nr:hypothetical protein [Epibacterium ulvae]MBT8155261.1 hypothetical protein [Epibacterium ulvae]
MDVFENFYEDIDRRLLFFRQYYRFYLSICMDLEDLGYPGIKSEKLAQWVLKENIVEAELSDLQRAEAHRLLKRRNLALDDMGLNDRLRAFTDCSAQFAIPNTKIAYELTHIVFYLSEYGRKDPQLPGAALVSLRHVGTLAYLDQNMDLLAEVCIALRYAGSTVPKLWEDTLAASMRRYRFIPGAFDGNHDDYHMYFVGAWWAMLAGRGGFEPTIPGGAMMIRAARTQGVMRTLSQVMFSNENFGRLPWSAARPRIMASLSPDDGELLRSAEQGSPHFERFFEAFARNGRVA